MHAGAWLQEGYYVKLLAVINKDQRSKFYYLEGT